MNKKIKRNRKQRFKDRKSISDSEIQQKKKDKRHWETLGYHLSFFLDCTSGRLTYCR